MRTQTALITALYTQLGTTADALPTRAPEGTMAHTVDLELDSVITDAAGHERTLTTALKAMARATADAQDALTGRGEFRGDLASYARRLTDAQAALTLDMRQFEMLAHLRSLHGQATTARDDLEQAVRDANPTATAAQVRAAARSVL